MPETYSPNTHEVQQTIPKETELEIINFSKDAAQKYLGDRFYDDLVAEGVLGALEAYPKHKSLRGASLKTYIQTRIQGAMLDFLRKNDYLPRRERKIVKILKKIDNIEHYSDTELVDFIRGKEEKVSLQEIDTLRWIAKNGYYFNIIPEGLERCINNNNEDQRCISKIYTIFHNAINKLCNREEVYAAIYKKPHEKKNLKEIGKELGISESRISQIKKKFANEVRFIITPALFGLDTVTRESKEVITEINEFALAMIDGKISNSLEELEKPLTPSSEIVNKLAA
ncbi:sigma-70 family RNA polymerase sigma factor [Candidatus Peregrinibacteria bacterium]|jgi:RNA polymerase sigma factor FliA|nr:sigma-70 family RNA polymerase sigma factor [Candidatus Peregrinibacteria bacterium]